MTEKIQVLFVCLGNICRSPTAHGVFEQQLKAKALGEKIRVDSAGTGDWHIGKSPDTRAQQAALDRDCDISHLRARQVSADDFFQFHYILAMDDNNLFNLNKIKPDWYKGHLGRFLDFSEQADCLEVPDPYYGGDGGFTRVFDLINDASQGLLKHICHTHFDSED